MGPPPRPQPPPAPHWGPRVVDSRVRLPGTEPPQGWLPIWGPAVVDEQVKMFAAQASPLPSGIESLLPSPIPSGRLEPLEQSLPDKCMDDATEAPTVPAQCLPTSSDSV